eukprot:840738_1
MTFQNNVADTSIRNRSGEREAGDLGDSRPHNISSSVEEFDPLIPTTSAPGSEMGSIRDELGSVMLLIFLYGLQGVPLGLALGSVPFLLQEHSTLTQVGCFSLAAYPFSLKLLWAPIVDSIYSKSVGRRRSWIVPVQVVSGLMMIALSYGVEEMLGSATTKPALVTITVCFFLLVALVATQDIAVDGWALTLLSEKNRSWASMCQSIGQNMGFFASYTVFLALSSKEFCDKYLRSTPTGEGMVTLSSFMFYAS